MQKVAGNLEDYEEKRKKVSKFNLTSDVFFSNYKTDAFPHLARRVTMFKEERKGVDIMCKIIERERAEAKTEGFIAIVRKKYQKGNTPEQAAEALELDTEYVRSIMSMMDLQIMSDEEIAIKMVNEQNQNSYMHS